MIDLAGHFAVPPAEDAARLAEELIDEIDIMDVQVEHARLPRAARPETSPAGQTPRRWKLADFTLPYRPSATARLSHSHSDQNRMHMAGMKKPAALAAASAICSRLRERAGHRLFAEHVLARRQGRRHRLHVERRGQADINDIDLRIVHQFAPVGDAADAVHRQHAGASFAEVAAPARPTGRPPPAWGHCRPPCRPVPREAANRSCSASAP